MSEVEAQQNAITKWHKNNWIKFTNIFMIRLKQISVWLCGCGWFAGNRSLQHDVVRKVGVLDEDS